MAPPSQDNDDTKNRLPLIAYPISPLSMLLTAALAERAWMDATPSHFAKRCLPMLIANRAGWLLVSMHSFAVTWNGQSDAAGLIVKHLEGAPPYAAHSQFGSGILTFIIPFLFRTPPGVNLLVRGPANVIKDGIAPLEGIVETDWAEATFTMNWKMTPQTSCATTPDGGSRWLPSMARSPASMDEWAPAHSAPQVFGSARWSIAASAYRP